MATRRNVREEIAALTEGLWFEVTSVTGTSARMLKRKPPMARGSGAMIVATR